MKLWKLFLSAALLLVVGLTFAPFSFDVEKASAQNFTATQVLNQVYGSFSTACTQDADADTGQHNRVAMAAGRRYVVYCHDGPPGTGTGAGVACECLQGTSTVDASSAVGFTMTAGEKVTVLQKFGNTHISCDPFSNNTYIDVCPLD